MKLLLLISLIPSICLAWNFDDFKDEITSPITTEAKSAFLFGAIVTSTVLIFEDQTVDPVQDETTEDKPLGSFSVYGDWAGQMVPNGLYLIGQSIAGLSGNTKGYQRALGMFKATAYSTSITTVLKYTIREGRPNNHQERNSFPSGHTTSAFAFGGYVYAEHGPKWGIPAMGLAFLSGYSRINDNRHYLHDVLAGATIGFSYGYGISKLQNKNEQLSYILMPLFDHQIKGIALVTSF